MTGCLGVRPRLMSLMKGAVMKNAMTSLLLLALICIAFAFFGLVFL